MSAATPDMSGLARRGGLAFTSRSDEETRAFGSALARALPEGTVVALVGELGAGKTVLVQGAAEGLGVGTVADNVRHGDTETLRSTRRTTDTGVSEKPSSVSPCLRGVRSHAAEEENDVISPTFVLVREHTGADGRKLVHVDAHRLKGARELEDLGSGDFLGRTGIAFVEWAERVYDALPRPCLVIRLSHESETARRLELGGIGPGHEELVEVALRALKTDGGDHG